MGDTQFPEVGSRWTRADFDSSKGAYNAYTVIAIGNVGGAETIEPCVIYKGDNGKWWSKPLSLWPGNLISEIK